MLFSCLITVPWHHNDREEESVLLLCVTCWSPGIWWSPASSWLSRSGYHVRTLPLCPPRPLRWSRPPSVWSSLCSTGWCSRASAARLEIFLCYRDQGSRSEVRLEINLAKSLKNNWPLKYFIFFSFPNVRDLNQWVTPQDHDCTRSSPKSNTFLVSGSNTRYLVCCLAGPCRPLRVPPTRECACRDSCAASAGRRGAGDPCTGRLCAGRAACGGSGESGEWWNVRWD